VKVILHAEARREYADAVRYYRDHAGLGIAADFIREFDRTVAAALETPTVGAPYLGYHRFLFRRFPYSLVYEVKPRILRVLAVAHQSRRPGYWADRR
jgi:plasmid stabilization system protein ParE